MPAREAAFGADLEHSERRAHRDGPRLARDEQRLQNEQATAPGNDDEYDEQRAIDPTGEQVRRDGRSRDDKQLAGEPPRGPWAGVDWDADPDWEFTSAAADTPEQLYRLWDEAVERSRARTEAALADGGLDQLVHASDDDGRRASFRRLLCDLVEEYGRHTGHADLLREAVDGLVGEDPPAGWRPVGPAGAG